MFGGIKNFDAHNPFIFPEIEHNILRESPVGDLLFAIIVLPIAGMLGDRFGRRAMAYWGMAVMGLSIMGLGLVEYTFGQYLLLFVLLGAGSATAWTSLNTLAIQVAPDLRKPVVSVYNT